MVRLHYEVKVKHKGGRVDEALEDARWAVRAAIGEMEEFEGEQEQEQVQEQEKVEDEDEEVEGWGEF